MPGVARRFGEKVAKEDEERLSLQQFLGGILREATASALLPKSDIPELCIWGRSAISSVVRSTVSVTLISGLVGASIDGCELRESMSDEGLWVSTIADVDAVLEVWLSELEQPHSQWLANEEMANDGLDATDADADFCC